MPSIFEDDKFRIEEEISSDEHNLWIYSKKKTVSSEKSTEEFGIFSFITARNNQDLVNIKLIKHLVSCISKGQAKNVQHKP